LAELDDDQRGDAQQPVELPREHVEPLGLGDHRMTAHDAPLERRLVRLDT
jgi:hypothetical protein